MSPLSITIRSIIICLRGVISRGLSTVNENSVLSLLVNYLNTLKEFADNPPSVESLYLHEYIRQLLVIMVGWNVWGIRPSIAWFT